METQTVNPLLNADYYWKEKQLDSVQTLSEEYNLSDEDIFKKFPFINSILRDGLFYDLSADKEPTYVLFIDDLSKETIELTFPSSVKDFIRIVVNTGSNRAYRHLKFSNDVNVTEINACSHVNYSTCIYESLKDLSIFIFEKERESFTKQNTIVLMNKPNTNAFVKIAIQTQEGQKRDDYIEFQHTSANTHSEVSYLSLNKGQVTSQANSLLDVNSRQSASFQNLKHVLLNEKAKSFSKPNLMIQNPDVMAQHGNNIGALNESNLEYLQMRGIDKDTARHIIQKNMIESFINQHPNAQHIKDIYYDFKR